MCTTINKLIYQVRANTIFGFLVNMEHTIAIYSYSTPWALFPQKWCVAPEFFVLISSHCSTQIWRMRYGGPWSIYFLGFDIRLVFTLPPRDSTLQYKRCVLFWNNFPCATSLLSTTQFVYNPFIKCSTLSL